MTVAFNYAAFFAASRPLFGGKLTQMQVDGLNAALKAGFAISAPGPAWLVAGRTKIGEKEIPGPKHNPWIVNSMWKALGAPWLKTDDADSPWCGGFMAWCMNEAGQPYPKSFPSAGAWATWGVPCLPQIGAVIVKERDGGHHVAQLVGITADGLWYLALGGNQNDGVSIAPIAIASVTAVRWPANVPQLSLKLPVMARATTAAREA